MQEKSGSKSQQGAKDNPGQAFEEGEPKLTGRSHGEIIDDQGAGAGKEAMEEQQDKRRRGHNDNTSGASGKISQAPESGRQRATP